MSSTILRLAGTPRLVLGLILLVAAPLGAHEIPSRVTVLAFVKPEAGRLRVILRAPLEAMRDVNFPERGLGYLDLRRADPLAREAARLWIADYVAAFENGQPLPAPRIVATRISLPSDRAFASYDSALARVTGAPLDPTDRDPLESDRARRGARLCDRVADVAASRSSRGSRALACRPRPCCDSSRQPARSARISMSAIPELIRLDPRWHHAAAQFVKLGVHAHSWRHRSPAVRALPRHPVSPDAPADRCS